MLVTSLICNFSQKALPFVTLGFGLLASGLYKSNNMCEENQENKEKLEEVDFAINLDNFDELTDQNLTEVMSNDESKFIFYFDPEKVTSEFVDEINKHAARMASGLGWKWYFLDTAKYNDVFKDNLLQRKMNSKLQEEIDTNWFILANKFDDVGFKN